MPPKKKSRVTATDAESKSGDKILEDLKRNIELTKNKLEQVQILDNSDDEFDKDDYETAARALEKQEGKLLAATEDYTHWSILKTQAKPDLSSTQRKCVREMAYAIQTLKIDPTGEGLIQDRESDLRSAGLSLIRMFCAEWECEGQKQWLPMKRTILDPTHPDFSVRTPSPGPQSAWNNLKLPDIPQEAFHHDSDDEGDIGHPYHISHRNRTQLEKYVFSKKELESAAVAASRYLARGDRLEDSMDYKGYDHIGSLEKEPTPRDDEDGSNVSDKFGTLAGKVPSQEEEDESDNSNDGPIPHRYNEGNSVDLFDFGFTPEEMDSKTPLSLQTTPSPPATSRNSAVTDEEVVAAAPKPGSPPYEGIEDEASTGSDLGEGQAEE